MSPLVGGSGVPVTINLSVPVPPEKALAALFQVQPAIEFRMNVCPECGLVAMVCDPKQLSKLPEMKDRLTVVKGGKD